MSQPVKKVVTSSFAALCLLGSAWGQSTVSFTNSAVGAPGTSYQALSLSKFDTSLGTLTGVTVVVNFINVDGTFTVTSNTAEETEVAGALARLTVRQASTNALGFTQIGQTTNSLTTAPALPFNVAGNSSQIFDVDSANFLVGQSQSIATNFWSAYTGAGSVTFEFRNLPFIDAAGDNYSVSSTAIVAIAEMSVTYSYSGAEPIPEPSTVAAGAFLTVLAAASYWRRRRSAR